MRGRGPSNTTALTRGRRLVEVILGDQVHECVDDVCVERGKRRGNARGQPCATSKAGAQHLPSLGDRTMQGVEVAFCMELVKCAIVTTTNNPEADATS